MTWSVLLRRISSQRQSVSRAAATLEGRHLQSNPTNLLQTVGQNEATSRVAPGQCRVECVLDSSCTAFAIHRPTPDVANCFFSSGELTDSDLIANQSANTVFKFGNTAGISTESVNDITAGATTEPAVDNTAATTTEPVIDTGLFVSSGKSPDGTLANQNATCQADGGRPALLTSNALVREVVRRFVPSMELVGVWTTMTLQNLVAVWPDGTKFVDTDVTYLLVPDLIIGGACYRFSSLQTFQQHPCVSLTSSGYVICTV
ncbi:uncharacterized protein [Penaeus vannamei]|uniref:uncharacterized protein n=1 Tax=Penaeus vannamei TaxID=6689 RepID=UPI00387F4CD1